MLSFRSHKADAITSYDLFWFNVIALVYSLWPYTFGCAGSRPFNNQNSKVEQVVFKLLSLDVFKWCIRVIKAT